MGGADGKVGELGPHAARDCIWNLAVDRERVPEDRLSLQPARQRLRQAASRDVVPALAGRASRIVPYRLIRD
jgi:hypothetical protein